MRREPRVSVGLPVYNAERYLEGAILSHLAQTFDDFELIISDNGSTDRTRPICEDFARRDRRIRYVRADVNRGLSWNHARVFELSRGTFFRWGAADDLMSPDLLSEALALLEAEPRAVLCVPRTVNIDAEGGVTGELPRTLDLDFDDVVRRVEAVLFRSYQMVYPQGLMRRAALLRTRRQWTYFGWDFVLLLELALLGHFRQTQQATLLRRLHEGQASRVQRDAQSGVARIEPTFGTRWVFPHWRWQVERARAVLASDLRFGQRVAILGMLARQTWWSRSLLARDLTSALGAGARRQGRLPL